MHEEIILGIALETLSPRQVKALAYISKPANVWKATRRLKDFVKKILETAETLARTEAALVSPQRTNGGSDE